MHPRLHFLLNGCLLAILCYFGHQHGAISSTVPAPAAFFSPFSGFWQQAEPLKSHQTSAQQHPTYQGQIIYDERAVPHFFADNRESVAFLQGYAHARHRLWQMDISTRATAGRLAEILGPDLAARDRQQRRKGVLQAARTNLQAWYAHPPTAALIDAYTEGVNYFLADLQPADYPLEYKLLGYSPEPWTSLKSAIFSKSMAESLCARNRDIESSTMLSLLGDSLFQTIYPEYNPDQSPIIPSDTPWDFAPVKVADPTLDTRLSWTAPTPNIPQAPEGIGSNNWAISGQKSVTGSPMLANDPHLQLTLPSIWYEAQIHTPESNSYGVTLPGLPGILIGFNTQSAWGITNVGQDVLDWYRIQWTDSTHTHYLLDGKATAVEWISDTIYVRGEQPIIERTPWTYFGPVVYEDDQNSPYYGLAMRWVSHDPPYLPSRNKNEVFFDLQQNGSVGAYQAALNGYDNPGSNIVYANQAGDIALTVTGHFPLRAPQQGRFIQAGETRAANWSGFIPYPQIPATVNPKRGFVASANQRSTSLDYPYYYLGTFDDYRGRYINRRLDSMEQVTVADMQALQFDSYSLKAEQLVPLILRSLASTKLNLQENKAREVLQNWDYRHTAASTGAVLFQQVLDSLYQLTFDEVWQYQSEDRPILYPETWRMIDLLTNSPEHPVLDHLQTPARENADSLLRQAFRQASHQPVVATWNERRATRIRHLARIPGLGTDLLYTDGARDTPNALSSGFGPSWRMVVSLEQPIRAWGVLPGGASGNPGSRDYQSGIEAWCKGEYFELLLWDGPTDPNIQYREKISFE